MSWMRVYRLALHLLPGELRRKHGPAMETLFEHQLSQARDVSRAHGAFAAVAGIGDVLRRSAYELMRPVRDAAGECGDHPALLLPTSDQLLRRLAASFAIAFVALTASLLGLFIRKQVAELGGRGAPAGTLLHVVLLAVPFTAAMTIPMAVFVAVLREFTRLGADGTLAAARRKRDGLRRLVLPVLGATAIVAGLAFVELAEVVPRANTRLATILMGPSSVPNGRTMTLGELGVAEQTARLRSTRVDDQDAAIYEVEIQKKFALPAACLVVALVAIAISLLIPRGGMGIVLGASCVVFGAYYLLIATGEMLATRLVVSPAVGMWGANALLLALALLAVGTSRATGTSGDDGAALLDG